MWIFARVTKFNKRIDMEIMRKRRNFRNLSEIFYSNFDYTGIYQKRVIVDKGGYKLLDVLAQQLTFLIA
jgi:hypothetical protein